MRISLTESELRQIILTEIHHALDEGLIEVADNIASYFINMADDISKYTQNPNNYVEDLSKVFNCGQTIGDMLFRLVKGTNCGYDPAHNSIYIGIDNILTKNQQALASLIYHELGHKINHIKSDSSSQLKKDFDTPLFLSMKDDEYKDISRKIYRFQTRELKARCFEATMWLKHCKEIPSLKEYYDNRCTDITLMKEFIDYLKSCNENIIDSLYKEIIPDGFWKVIHNPNITSDIKRDKVLTWFITQYKWFKKRIDKIYYDYVNQQNNFKQ